MADEVKKLHPNSLAARAQKAARRMGIPEPTPAKTSEEMKPTYGVHAPGLGAYGPAVGGVHDPVFQDKLRRDSFKKNVEIALTPPGSSTPWAAQVEKGWAPPPGKHDRAVWGPKPSPSERAERHTVKHPYSPSKELRIADE